MNNVIVRGYIRDIEYSHSINGVDYNKANIVCPSNTSGKDDDIISIVCKQYTNKYKENDFIEIKGNLRSYSTKIANKNLVQIYVFTYFDYPEIIPAYNTEIDGRICLINELKHTKSGKEFLHFTLANNIFTPGGKKINNYIPCTCYGSTARELSKCNVGDTLHLYGNLHSHCYKKYLNLDNDIFEYRIAHEIVVDSFDTTLVQEGRYGE